MSRAGTIDGLQFARDRDVVTGKLDLPDLPRLAEMGCLSAEVSFSVRGGENGQGRACLEVSTSGALGLRCQRCLERFEFGVRSAIELELSSSEREIATADDGIDRVLAARAMDVAAMVEDELILALPIAPMHERCEPPALAQDWAANHALGALGGLRESGRGES
jgi:uncharacterized protein